MATIQEVHDLITLNETQQGSSDRITGAEVRAVDDTIITEVGRRGTITVANTAALATIPITESGHVFIDGVGVFSPLTTVTPPDNVNTFASATSGSVWKRILNDFVTANVKDYGAIGNGIADDSAAFVAAIATLLPVEVPEGDFLISQELLLNDGQMIFGYGRKSNLVTNTNGTTSDLNTAYNILQVVHDCTVKNLRFTGNGKIAFVAPWTSQNGIWVKGNTNLIDGCEFLNLRGSGVFGIETGFGLQNDNKLVNSKFQLCTCGIYTQFSSEYWNITNCSFNQCDVNVNELGANNSYSNCSITYGHLGVRHFLNSGNSDHSQFSNCQINHNDEGVHIEGIANGVHFVGCSFYNTNSIHIIESVKVLFIGCGFNAMTIDANATTAKEVSFINCYSIAGTVPTFTNLGQALITRIESLGSGGHAIYTNNVLRLKISHLGEWLIGGTAGAASQSLRSQGAGLPPQWAAASVTTFTPVNSADPAGDVGDITKDDNNIYLKTPTGWKRATLGAF